MSYDISIKDWIVIQNKTRVFPSFRKTISSLDGDSSFRLFLFFSFLLQLLIDPVTFRKWMTLVVETSS